MDEKFNYGLVGVTKSMFLETMYNDFQHNYLHNLNQTSCRS